MTKPTRSLDHHMMRRARQVLGTTAAALALSGIGLAQAQGMDPPRPGPAEKTPSPAEMAFNKVDVNHDGRLSKAEVSKLPGVAANFAVYDKDKDNFLNIDEFVAAYTAPQ